MVIAEIQADSMRRLLPLHFRLPFVQQLLLKAGEVTDQGG